MKIKIAFLMEHIITGGIENCLIQVLRGLKEYPDYDITVISRRPVKEERFLSFFKENNIKLIDSGLFKYTIQDRPEHFFARKIWRIKSRIEKIRVRHALKKYDLLVDYFNGTFLGIIRKVHRPRIAFYHCSFNVYSADGTYIHNMPYYNRIVSISKSFYDDLVQRHPDKKNKFKLVYNPIDSERICKQCNESKKIEINNPYFVSVARLHEDKDHETLIRAFAKFINAEPESGVKLYLCGDGPLRSKWENLANQLSLANHIVFVGNTSNPFGYVRGSLAHILSTFGEGLPTVLIEAQALGIPNIASNVKSGVAEILMDGDAGLLFTGGDSDELAARMSDIYHNRVNVNKITKNGIDGLKRFAADKIIIELNDLFKEVVNEKQ